MNIRVEQQGDAAGIRRVHEQAFGGNTEADLVDALRGTGIELISRVAVDHDVIIGHILFSPVTIDGHEEIKVMGLAPMAVLPERQRQGIGTQLVKAGLAACTEADCDGVIVLGHATYYPRFGFVPAGKYGLQSEYDVLPEVFMVRELRQDALQGVSGTARYHQVFNEV